MTKKRAAWLQHGAVHQDPGTSSSVPNQSPRCSLWSSGSGASGVSDARTWRRTPHREGHGARHTRPEMRRAAPLHRKQALNYNPPTTPASAFTVLCNTQKGSGSAHDCMSVPTSSLLPGPGGRSASSAPWQLSSGPGSSRADLPAAAACPEKVSECPINGLTRRDLPA